MVNVEGSVKLEKIFGRILKQKIFSSTISARQAQSNVLSTDYEFFGCKPDI